MMRWLVLALAAVLLISAGCFVLGIAFSETIFLISLICIPAGTVLFMVGGILATVLVVSAIEEWSENDDDVLRPGKG